MQIYVANFVFSETAVANSTALLLLYEGLLYAKFLYKQTLAVTAASSAVAELEFKGQYHHHHHHYYYRATRVRYVAPTKLDAVALNKEHQQQDQSKRSPQPQSATSARTEKPVFASRVLITEQQ